MMGSGQFERIEIPEAPSSPEKGWLDLESERPNETELPHIEINGQDAKAGLEWKADDSGREITELPRVEAIESGAEINDKATELSTEGNADETDDQSKKETDAETDKNESCMLGEAEGQSDEKSDNDSECGEKNEIEEKKGGSYRDVKKTSDGEIHEVHHMPSDSATKLERNDGPAIKMEKGDHRQTASCGNSREAREYREKQKELIEQGKFREALQMDIDDIHEKFGDKYDDAIEELLNYVDELEEKGEI